MKVTVALAGTAAVGNQSIATAMTMPAIKAKAALEATSTMQRRKKPGLLNKPVRVVDPRKAWHRASACE